VVDIAARQHAVTELKCALAGAPAAPRPRLAHVFGVGGAGGNGGGGGGKGAGLVGVVAAVRRCGDLEALLARVRGGTARPSHCLALCAALRRLLEAMADARAAGTALAGGATAGGATAPGAAGGGGAAGVGGAEGAGWRVAGEEGAAPRAALLRELLHPKDGEDRLLVRWLRVGVGLRGRE